MKNWIKLLIGFLTFGCSAQLKIISEQEFSKIYMDSLKQTYPTVSFEVVDNLTITASDNGKEFKYYLDNAYKEYKLDPKSLSEIIKRYIAASAELYKEKKPIRTENIIPVIKPIDYLDELKKISKENGEEKESWIVYEKYNDELIVVFGEDTENSIAYFTQTDFEKLNINKDTLLEFSIENLRRILPNIEKIGEKNLYGLAAGGYLEASLILLPKLWTKENFDILGDIVVSIPNKDLIFITGTENKVELNKVKEMTEKSYNEGNGPVSPYLFKWNGKKFERLK
jgi:uncharacterized protein YtpQ (UPF0354 family)